MTLQMDNAGMVNHPRVTHARSAAIERGKIKSISGIIVHQTDADTSAATLNSYKNAGANGAHFLIDTDGAIYQTASVHQRTNHIGKLKSRCLTEMTCKPSSYPPKPGAAAINRIEMKKAVPSRYPSNAEAIGIELVGKAKLPANFQAPASASKMTPDELMAEYGVYPTPSASQNASLKWLVEELTQTLQISKSEIFKHPVVSWKNPTEARGAQW